MDCEEATAMRAAKMTLRKRSTLEKAIVSLSVSLSPSLSQPQERKERKERENRLRFNYVWVVNPNVPWLPFIMPSQ